MQIIKGLNGGEIRAWTDGVEIEDQALDQLHKLAALPFIKGHVAVMPDVHAGCGSTIGSVFVTEKAIIPAAVGVDIGCGMMAVKTFLKASDLPDDLALLRSHIEAIVPHGRTDNGGINDRGAWGEAPDDVNVYFQAQLFTPDILDLVTKYPNIQKNFTRCHKQLATLGTGNHFVELCLDENQDVWVMLHSGSRGIGNAIGNLFIELAKKDMERFFINLPDRDLAYIPYGSPYFRDYINAMRWAQKYAEINRQLMMQRILTLLTWCFPSAATPLLTNETAINCHHNYIREEKGKTFITRKGAVRITPDTLGIIPGSMGAKSFIVRGKEGIALAEAHFSCSHGAGRRMSRTKARATFTLDDHIKATEGVECRKDIDVIDETPAAYKDIDAVMAAQADHVEIVHTLKQILCVKG